MDLITLLLAALATARITRLVTTDYITAGPRAWVLRRTERWEMIQYLTVCDWCTSVYVAAGVAASGWAWADTAWWPWVAGALAFSHMTGWMASKEGDA